MDESHGQTSLAIDAAEHHWVFSQLPWLVAVIAALACVETTADARVVAACVSASAVFLALIDRAEPRIGWHAARVLADVALLTPLVPLWWWR